MNEQVPGEQSLNGKFIELDGRKIAVGLAVAGMFGTIAAVVSHELHKHAASSRTDEETRRQPD